MRVVSSTGVPTGRRVGHHAPSIRDLDAFITLSLQSHRYHRISINDSIVGEFATVLLICSFLIRFSFTSLYQSNSLCCSPHNWFSRCRGIKSEFSTGCEGTQC
jgi:hypothetical protein